MKLFEIPVYAISKDALIKRVKAKKEKTIKKYDLSRDFDDKRIPQRIIDLETYPQRLWNYNHIVGFITISIEEHDIVFDQYVPANKVERYCWDSNKKIFLKDNELNGYHFPYNTLKTGDEIRERIHDLFDEIADKIVDKCFYVDREAFNQADSLIDYSRLLED